TSAYTPCPSCIAARRSLMTGMTPYSQGMVGYQDGKPWDYEHTLAGTLRDAGYQTVNIGKTHFHPARAHLGFEQLTTSADYSEWLDRQEGLAGVERLAHGVPGNSWLGRPNHLPEHQNEETWFVTQALDFLRHRDPTRPYLLCLSFNGPHPRLRADTSHLFFVTTKEGLSLFIVHDMPNDPDDGRAIMRLRVGGDPDGVRVLVFDDPYSEWDFFKASPGGREIRTWHRWFPCCTDGLALGSLDGGWKVFLEFPAADALTGEPTFTGLKHWKAFSAGEEKLALGLKKGRRVRLNPLGPLVKGPPVEDPLVKEPFAPGGDRPLNRLYALKGETR
ncbi:MAG: sulfatase-like hydrolase/transferase, partial [Nitrospinota bacterium]|nr:sulfatase-like hydrolase/transferase [Nitrospinota bacterium]